MSGTEFKTLQNFEIKDSDHGIVTAHVTTIGVVDRDREVILDNRPATAMISDHSHSIVLQGAAPVGKGKLTFTGNAGIFRGSYFMNVPRCRDAFEVVKQMGPDLHWSMSFLVERDSEPSAEWRARGAVRMLEKLDVFEVSPVARGASLPGTSTLSAKAARAVADPAVVKEGLAIYRRTQALEAARRERNGYGLFCLDITEKATRWLTLGREQEPPLVRFYDPDGTRRTGYYDVLRPGEINIRRGLSKSEAVKTIGNELTHALSLGLAGEGEARFNEDYVYRRYRESLGAS